MTEQLSGLKVILCEHRLFGNPHPALTGSTQDLATFIGKLDPAYTTRRVEAALPILVVLGLGLPPFARPKDDARPVVVGIVCHADEYRRAYRRIAPRLRHMPKNTFLIICCTNGDAPTYKVPSRCRVIQPQDLHGENGAALRAEIIQWRSMLKLPAEVT